MVGKYMSLIIRIYFFYSQAMNWSKQNTIMIILLRRPMSLYYKSMYALFYLLPIHLFIFLARLVNFIYVTEALYWGKYWNKVAEKNCWYCLHFYFAVLVWVSFVSLLKTIQILFRTFNIFTVCFIHLKATYYWGLIQLL